MSGIVASTVPASLITVVGYTLFDDVFTDIVPLSVLTAVIPTCSPPPGCTGFWCTAACLDRRALPRDVTVAVLAMGFSS
ncbi:hypothetical protein [Streptomyces sp. NPDC014676]|uniref:hypothetical protein n=1 Tax=Streptomyces sp. NPDC014676 TaxID=3364879 RepID=UPI0036FEAFB2